MDTVRCVLTPEEDTSAWTHPVLHPTRVEEVQGKIQTLGLRYCSMQILAARRYFNADVVVTLSFFVLIFLKDVLQALFSGLCYRRLSSDPAVQAAHASLRHTSQSQCGTTVSFLRVGCPARSYILYHTGARIRGWYGGPCIWHQRRSRQGDHLHAAGSEQTRTSATQGAGHHHLTARPYYLPEHLYHLHLYLIVPLLSRCAAL